MTLETRALLRRDWTYAMKLLRDAMDALIKISGSSGLMQSNPCSAAGATCTLFHRTW